MLISPKDFDCFINWLKKDGIRPNKSERLWRKTIFSGILNDESKSIENYKDFKASQQYVNELTLDFLLGKSLIIRGEEYVVNDFYDDKDTLTFIFVDHSVVLKREASKILFQLYNEGVVPNIQESLVINFKNKTLP